MGLPEESTGAVKSIVILLGEVAKLFFYCAVIVTISAAGLMVVGDRKLVIEVITKGAEDELDYCVEQDVDWRPL